MKQGWVKRIAPYCCMLPALFLGMLAMHAHGVSVSIWIQNGCAWVLAAAVGCLYPCFGKKAAQARHSRVLPACFALFLLLPFFFEGLGGVHRWVFLGPIGLHAGFLLIPQFLIGLSRLQGAVAYRLGLCYFVLLVLLLQPDASQVTALCCASMLLLWRDIPTAPLRLLHGALMGAAAILSWVFLDSLAPVAHVEGILYLLADMGTLWLILGITSLIAALSPFLLFYRQLPVWLPLTAYYLILLLSTLFGHFPVPFLGYGVSPVIGCALALGALGRRTRFLF